MVRTMCYGFLCSEMLEAIESEPSVYQVGSLQQVPDKAAARNYQNMYNSRLGHAQGHTTGRKRIEDDNRCWRKS